MKVADDADAAVDDDAKKAASEIDGVVGSPDMYSHVMRFAQCHGACQPTKDDTSCPTGHDYVMYTVNDIILVVIASDQSH